MRTRFAPSAPAASFTVEARWQDRFVPIVRVRGNTRPIVEDPLPSPFATTALRVMLETPGQLAEVDVERLDVVPAGTARLPRRRRARTGVTPTRSRRSTCYGAEGPAGSVDGAASATSTLPDRPPVSRPSPLGRDVRLTWTANAEPDLAGYVVVRDGERIGSASSASFRIPTSRTAPTPTR